MNNPSSIQDIGQRSPRFDAPDKTRGKETFASDVYSENLLWAGALRAGIAHANPVHHNRPGHGKGRRGPK